MFDDRMRADTITDFEDGIDLFDFSSFGYSSTADFTILQTGTSVEIRTSVRDVLYLQNTDIADIDDSDFIF